MKREKKPATGYEGYDMASIKHIKYKGFFPLIAAVIVASAACGRTFPTEVTDRVDKSISFSDLIKDPGNYKGKSVMLAGTIVAVKAEKNGTYIEVLQHPADRSGKPGRTDESGGRFMAVSKQFLDPAIYSRGLAVTVVGEVIGDSVKPLGEIAYRYPLLEIEAVHIWEPSYGPRSNVSVGLGVGVFHRF